MYDAKLLIWNDDIKKAETLIKDECNKRHLDGSNLLETISLGKVGCLLVFFNPGNDYEAPEPLTTDPDDVPEA